MSTPMMSSAGSPLQNLRMLKMRSWISIMHTPTNQVTKSSTLHHNTHADYLFISLISLSSLSFLSLSLSLSLFLSMSLTAVLPSFLSFSPSTSLPHFLTQKHSFNFITPLIIIILNLHMHKISHHCHILSDVNQPLPHTASLTCPH
jgi:hypothetical protein